MHSASAPLPRPNGQLRIDPRQTLEIRSSFSSVVVTSLSGSPSPTSCAAFRFDSFEQEVGGISYKGGDGGLSPPSVSSPTPGTAFYKGGGGGGVGDRERLVLEVTKLYRERNRLARIHRKAELRVLTSLRRRRQVVENLLSRQKQAHEQVKQARTSYYSLLLRKQQEEKELKENLERFDDQVCVSDMVRLVVETEAFAEEINIQENSISAHQASLKQMAEKFKKLCQQKNDFEESITKVKETLNSLSKQLTEERNKLKDLSKMQAKTQLLVRSLKPSSRLLLDPVLARDLEEKLAVKHKLEDEISRLKQCNLTLASISFLSTKPKDEAIQRT
ncbi:hypothetical protein E2C01_021209 [Portunus trituberculatus]|uniref:Uncharacterized protein n=1 Tax=Portunus trituberculatus TaxID=210409 RepID=A0A5B7E4C7_PORTR|nr:hypothetical protein [Portunus trituberculatus]